MENIFNPLINLGYDILYKLGIKGIPQKIHYQNRIYILVKDCPLALKISVREEL